MLHGLDKGWFEIFADAQKVMRSALIERKAVKANRHNPNFGILVDDDYWALVYQINHYRARRAKHALLGSGMRWYAFSNGSFDDNDTAKRKGALFIKNFVKKDWERYLYAKRKIKEDYPYLFDEE